MESEFHPFQGSALPHLKPGNSSSPGSLLQHQLPKELYFWSPSVVAPQRTLVQEKAGSGVSQGMGWMPDSGSSRVTQGRIPAHSWLLWMATQVVLWYFPQTMMPFEQDPTWHVHYSLSLWVKDARSEWRENSHRVMEPKHHLLQTQPCTAAIASALRVHSSSLATCLLILCVSVWASRRVISMYERKKEKTKENIIQNKRNDFL